MSDRREQARQRELRIARALGELLPAEVLEADLAAAPDDYELAAAALNLAFEKRRAPVPADLRRSIEARALDHLLPRAE